MLIQWLSFPVQMQYSVYYRQNLFDFFQYTKGRKILEKKYSASIFVMFLQLCFIDHIPYGHASYAAAAVYYLK